MIQLLKRKFKVVSRRDVPSYDRDTFGKYGLHNKGEIVKITMWSTTIRPQELHFKLWRKGKWSYLTDFRAFSNSRISLMILKIKLKLRKQGT